jgi:two-component system chemotaxis response regulator CheY
MSVALSAVPTTASAAGTDPIRVMVVDDAVVVRGLVSRWIEQEQGLQVVASLRTGREAVDQLERANPDVVLLDVDMPVLDGIETLEQLRSDATTSHATIVMLTAAHGDSVERRAEEAGADLFLTKPFSPLDLLRLVDELGEQT